MHLEHVEDLILINGRSGAEKSIEFIRKITEKLSGNSEASVKLSTKWDGSPSIVAGINPENGRFFVGTKSVFNKGTPKINYTFRDINRNHEGSLADVLKVALKQLKKLDITGILQGDLMFTASTLDYATIDGEKSVVFRPNTIVYVVPVKSEMGKQIMQSQIGVIWHTSYHGESMSELVASYDVDMDSMKKTKGVWTQRATYEDLSGTATLTRSETSILEKKTRESEGLLDAIDKNIFTDLISDKDFKYMFRIYINKRVKEGAKLRDANDYVNSFFEFYMERKSDDVEKYKQTPTIERKKMEMEKGLAFLKSHRTGLVKLVMFYKHILQCKAILINKMNQLGHVKTLVKSGEEYQITNPEGFVAVDSKDNMIVKLVDRLDFSRMNFIRNEARRASRENREVERLDESKLITSKTSYGQYTAKDVADLVFLYILIIQIMKNEFDMSHKAISYAKKTVRASNFDQFRTANTDLYSMLHVLLGKKNSMALSKLKKHKSNKAFLDSLTVNKGRVLVYLRNTAQGRRYVALDRQFLEGLRRNSKFLSVTIEA